MSGERVVGDVVGRREFLRKRELRAVPWFAGVDVLPIGNEGLPVPSKKFTDWQRQEGGLRLGYKRRVNGSGETVMFPVHGLGDAGRKECMIETLADVEVGEVDKRYVHGLYQLDAVFLGGKYDVFSYASVLAAGRLGGGQEVEKLYMVEDEDLRVVDKEFGRINDLVKSGDTKGLQTYFQQHPHHYYMYLLDMAVEFGVQEADGVSGDYLTRQWEKIGVLDEGNVGVVYGGMVDGGQDVVDLLTGINDVLGYLKDGVMWYTYSEDYDSTVKALQDRFPLAMSMRYCNQGLKEMFLRSLDKPGVKFLREILRRGDAKLYAGAKPVWSSAEKARGMDGRVDEELIKKGYDNVRFRLYVKPDKLGEVVGEMRLNFGLALKLLKRSLGERMDLYVSEWRYGADGVVEDRELRESSFPKNMRSYYKQLMMSLPKGSLIYAAVHVHFPLWFGKNVYQTELQLAPDFMQPMHYLLEKVFKQKEPGLRHVDASLVKRVRRW